MNFKKEIAPLPEGFADAISKSINKLQNVQEAPASRKGDKSEGDTKPQDISGSEEKANADKKAPARKGDQSQGDAMSSVKEEVELEEGFSPKEIKMAVGIASDKRYKGGNMTGAVKAIEKIKRGLSDHPQVSAVLKRQNEETEKEEIDAVNPKAVKKKFDDRKDKDIDNDGDEDSSDEYLHKRRKAISKALAKESVEELAELKNTHAVVDTAQGGKVVSVASNEKAAKSSIVSAERPPMSIKDKKTLKVVQLKRPISRNKDIIGTVLKAEYQSEESGDLGKTSASVDQSAKPQVQEDISEARKSDYTIYHKTFSSAVQHAIEVAKKQGYIVDEDDWHRKVATGPRKPGKGKTNSYHIDLTRNGKPTKQKLHMQVYYDAGRYELNMYIS